MSAHTITSSKTATLKISKGLSSTACLNKNTTMNLCTIYEIGVEFFKSSDYEKAYPYLYVYGKIKKRKSRSLLYQTKKILKSEPNQTIVTNLFSKLGLSNHPTAIYYLACRYRHGKGVEKNHQVADDLFLALIKSYNHVPSMLKIAKGYNGTGLKLYCLTKAAQLGSKTAKEEIHKMNRLTKLHKGVPLFDSDDDSDEDSNILRNGCWSNFENLYILNTDYMEYFLKQKIITKNMKRYLLACVKKIKLDL